MKNLMLLEFQLEKNKKIFYLCNFIYIECLFQNNKLSNKSLCLCLFNSFALILFIVNGSEES